MADKSKTSEEIVLHDVRLSFPNLWVPKPFEAGAKPRFEATFLLDPSRVDHALLIKTMKALIKKLAIDAYGEDIPSDILSGEKVCLKNNAITDTDGKVVQRKKYNGYENMYSVAAASPAKIKPGTEGKGNEAQVVYVPGTTTIDSYVGQPPVVGLGKQAVRDGQTGAPYAGSRVNAIISFWAPPRTMKGGARINANLKATQFFKDDEPLTRGGINIETDDRFVAYADAPQGDPSATAQPKAAAGFLD